MAMDKITIMAVTKALAGIGNVDNVGHEFL
jgi:hypothetical protein